jgi:glycosyl-4,4'-diaponeurosporenoate acyltransferase
VIFLDEASWGLFWFNAFLYALSVVVRRYVDVLLPKRCFAASNAWFRTRRWERDGDFYQDALGIKQWKDKLPCLNGQTRFSKKHITARNPDYFAQFIVETCRSESNHIRAIGFVVLMKLWTPLRVWILCLALATIGNLPFICIQRYNRPRLQQALDRANKRRSHAYGHPCQTRPALASPTMPAPALSTLAESHPLNRLTDKRERLSASPQS